MSFEQPPAIQSHYLKKSKCDKIQEFIYESGNLFIFQGETTPHGYYNIKIEYHSEKEIPLSEIKKHYNTLLNIVIGNKKEF